MALETFSTTFFFIGLCCLVIGNGLFKPNISSIVGQIYKDGDILKMGDIPFFIWVSTWCFSRNFALWIYERKGWMAFGLWFGWNFYVFWNASILFCPENIWKYRFISKSPAQTKLRRKKKRKMYLKKLKMIDFLLWLFLLFTIFFWWAFEQAGGSMTIFANDYADRNLVGTASKTFNIVNSIITLVPMVI